MSTQLGRVVMDKAQHVMKRLGQPIDQEGLGRSNIEVFLGSQQGAELPDDYWDELICFGKSFFLQMFHGKVKNPALVLSQHASPDEGDLETSIWKRLDKRDEPFARACRSLGFRFYRSLSEDIMEMFAVDSEGHLWIVNGATSSMKSVNDIKLVSWRAFGQSLLRVWREHFEKWEAARDFLCGVLRDAIEEIKADARDEFSRAIAVSPGGKILTSDSVSGVMICEGDVWWLFHPEAFHHRPLLRPESMNRFYGDSRLGDDLIMEFAPGLVEREGGLVPRNVREGFGRSVLKHAFLFLGDDPGEDEKRVSFLVAASGSLRGNMPEGGRQISIDR